MRIITGLYKGKHFEIPRTFKARPTTDFAKENLFNVLRAYLDFEDLKALDLFGGTGSITLELLSRGCGHVTTVEKDRKHFSFILECIKSLKTPAAHPLCGDALRFIERSKEPFDFIFADPPYQLENITDIPDLVFKHNHLNPDGLLIVEHGAKTSFENHPNFVDHRNYGNVHFSFFKLKD